MILIKRVLVFLSICSPLLSLAQIAKYSNEFLSMGVGARNLAMGDAVVSSTEDVTSLYYNPAALCKIKDKIQIVGMHNEQFAGISKHDFGAISLKLNEKSAIGLGFVRLGVDNIPNTLYLINNGQIDYSKITNFSAVDYAFIGSYATQTKIPGLLIGGNVKVIRRVIGDFASAWGFGLDVSAMYEKNNWRFGGIVRDVTSTFNAWSYNFSEADKQKLLETNNKLPSNSLEITLPLATFGASRTFHVYKKMFSFLYELDFDINTDGQRNVLISSSWLNINPRTGWEIGYKDFVYLRGGYSNVQRVKDITGAQSFNGMPSLGVGLKLNKIAIDYALGNAFNKDLLASSNIISVKIMINKK